MWSVQKWNLMNKMILPNSLVVHLPVQGNVEISPTGCQALMSVAHLLPRKEKLLLKSRELVKTKKTAHPDHLLERFVLFTSRVALFVGCGSQEIMKTTAESASIAEAKESSSSVAAPKARTPEARGPSPFGSEPDSDGSTVRTKPVTNKPDDTGAAKKKSLPLCPYGSSCYR